MRDSFIFYKSFYDAISELTNEQKMDVLLAVMEYGFYGREPEESGVAKAIFILVKHQIDEYNKTREASNTCRTGY